MERIQWVGRLQRMEKERIFNRIFQDWLGGAKEKVADQRKIAKMAVSKRNSKDLMSLGGNKWWRKEYGSIFWKKHTQ